MQHRGSFGIRVELLLVSLVEEQDRQLIDPAFAKACLSALRSCSIQVWLRSNGRPTRSNTFEFNRKAQNALFSFPPTHKIQTAFSLLFFLCHLSLQSDSPITLKIRSWSQKLVWTCKSWIEVILVVIVVQSFKDLTLFDRAWKYPVQKLILTRCERGYSLSA